MAKMKSVKMPTEFIVFGQPVKIIYHAEQLFMNERPVYGFYNYDNHTIEIGPHHSADELFKTMIHELGHSILDRLGVVRTSVHSDVNEIIVEGYSRFIHENFKLRLPKKVSKPPRKSSKKVVKR